MYPITIKVEKLFSVERRSGKNERYTEFGFSAGRMRQYSVIIPGWPVIEEGMEITALLGRQGDWATLLGWINHGSGEIAAPGQGLWAFLLVAGFLMTGGAALGSGHPGPLLLYALFAIPNVVMLRRASRIRSALRAHYRPATNT